MANFTINSLSSSTPVSTDTFLKSDSSGALTKVDFSTLKDTVTADSAAAEQLLQDQITSLNNALNYRVGDSVLFGGDFSAHTYSTASSIEFTIPLARPTAGNPTIAVVATRGYIIGANGSITVDPFNPTVVGIRGNHLRCTLTGINGLTANTSYVVSVQGSITFS